MRNLSLLLVILLFAPAAIADEHPACDKALTLRFNDVVPCDKGVLFPPGWALEATRLKTVLLPLCEADLAREQEERRIVSVSLRAELAACEVFADSQSDLLDKAIGISDTTSSTWYTSPLFWGIMGGVLGAVSGGLIVYFETH